MVSQIPTNEQEAAMADTPTQDTGPTPEAIVRALFVKGYATPPLLAGAVLATEEQLAPVVAATQAEGLVTEARGMFQLTDSGKARGSELMDADRAQWGEQAANAALDAFIALDDRMKKTVTAWQMREVRGEQVINDHTNAAYDAKVLADFRFLHRNATEWITPLGEGLPRLSAYAVRLNDAADKVADGDHAYIASPRVDSYHSIWFELHEDLIHLAGRTREDEVASGRA
jgi:pyruvate,orthophosphate dikinase